MDEFSSLATFRRTQLNEWMPRSHGRQSVKVRQLCFSAAFFGCDCVITDSATLKYQLRVLNTFIWATAFGPATSFPHHGTEILSKEAAGVAWVHDAFTHSWFSYKRTPNSWTPGKRLQECKLVFTQS
jgi:hypothetical protein